jgi:hypothetical protein
MTIESFSYLWDGSDDGWVLVRLSNMPQPAILNLVTGRALIIEDNESYAAVVQRMIDHGTEVIERLV